MCYISLLLSRVILIRSPSAAAALSNSLIENYGIGEQP
jgi:hypothetical protein